MIIVESIWIYVWFFKWNFVFNFEFVGKYYGFNYDEYECVIIKECLNESDYELF